MNETPMLFPIAPTEFWKQIKIIIEDAIAEKLSHLYPRDGIKWKNYFNVK